jgi:hypothetical protein
MGQESEPAQVHLSLGQRREHPRVSPRRPRDAQSLVRRFLRQMKLANAVREHRRIARRRVEPAPLDLGDQFDLARRMYTVISDARTEFSDQRVVREP